MVQSTKKWSGPRISGKCVYGKVLNAFVLVLVGQDGLKWVNDLCSGGFANCCYQLI